MEQLESRAMLALMSFNIQDNSGLDQSKYALYAMGSNFTSSHTTNWYMDSTRTFVSGLLASGTPSFKVQANDVITVPNNNLLAGVRLYFFVVPVGGVATATVTNGQYGYTSLPKVTFPTPAGGVAAEGVAVLGTKADPTIPSTNTSYVKSITITNPGRGYTIAPVPTIDPPGVVDMVTVTSGGSGYPNGSQSFLVTSRSSTGTAAASVTVSGNVVTSAPVTVTNRGAGYTPPTGTFTQSISISPGSNATANVTLVSAATATSTLFGPQGPSLPVATEPSNPPSFPFVTQFVEFTVTAGANTVDLQTVDGFTLPLTITAGSGNVNVVGKQFGQPIATTQQPQNAVVTRAAVFDAYQKFMHAQGTAGQPYLQLPYTLDGTPEGQSGGILSPDLYLTQANVAGDYANLTSPLDTVFKNDLSNLFSSATKLSVKGVSSGGAGGIDTQVYAVTYKSQATYPAPAGVTLKSGTGKDITHPALEFKGTNTFYMFDPAHLTKMGPSLTGKLSAGMQVFPNQTATLTLPGGLPSDVQKGWFVSGNGLFQGPGSNQGLAITPWYVQDISLDKKTITLAYTSVNGAVSDTAVTTTTASQYRFSKLPYMAMMQTPGQMTFGNAGVFADNAFQYPKGSNLATVLGNLEYQVAAALNRGVLFASGAQGATSGGTSTTWFTQSGWYPAGKTQNLFSLFMHVGQVPNGSGSAVPIFVQPANPVQIQGSGGPFMGSAYGFPFDENSANPPGGPQVPSKFDGNIGGTGGLPPDILVTFGPWGNASAPHVQSIDTLPAESPPGTPTLTTASSVQWTVLFNEAVSGVAASNFTLVPGGTLAGTSITSVTPVGGPASQTWTVTANTGTGSGLLRLNLTSAGAIKDATNKPLSLPAGGVSGEVYSVRPTGVSATVTIPHGAQNPTFAESVTFNVAFSQAVTGLSKLNFAVVVPGAGVTGAVVTQVSGIGTAYTVTVATGTGSGTLALRLRAPGTGIKPVPTGLPVRSAAYTIRPVGPVVAPVAQSITRTDANPTALPQVAWTVTFSKPVGGLTKQNFEIVSSGLNQPKILQVSPNGGSPSATWTVTAATGSGTGTLRLDLVNATGITDAVNLAPTGIPLTGQTYTVSRGGATNVNVPIAFMTTMGTATSLRWLMNPFTDRDSVQLTATLSASPDAAAGTFRAASGGGVTVSPSGTAASELTFTGTVANLNTYFRNSAGFIRYTPAGSSLLARKLSLSAQGNDDLSGHATAALLVRAAAPQSPAPALNAAATLAGTVGQPLVITYAQLVAATGATQTTSRSVQFILGGLNSGWLEVWTGSGWSVVPSQVKYMPLVAPFGKIRWTPPAGASGAKAAFSVKTWDGWNLSGVSQVSVNLTQ